MANISDIGGYIRLEVKGGKEASEVVSKADKDKITVLLLKAFDNNNYYGIYCDDLEGEWTDFYWGNNVSVWGNGRWSCVCTMNRYFEESWGALTGQESKKLARLFKKYGLVFVFHYTDVEEGNDFTDAGCIRVSVEEKNVDGDGIPSNFTYRIGE